MGDPEDIALSLIGLLTPPNVRKPVDALTKIAPIIKKSLDTFFDSPKLLDWISYNDPSLLPLNWPQFLTIHFLSLIPRSRDPNDKLAPTGFGDAAFIQADNSLAYTIRFENQPAATAPAQQVIITDALDADLALDTFELTEIAFADQRITVPPGLDHYEATIPIQANGADILVEAQSVLDRDSRIFTLTLQAIDPVTGWMPDDPFTGLLYPNDETRRGEGHISYTISPKPGLPSGTEILNRASIVFDFNDPIETPLVRNTLDAAAPQSSVAPLPPATYNNAFEIQWSGEDDTGGSGDRQL